MKTGDAPENSIIRMPLNYKDSASQLDPGAIVTIYQYEILRNLYGRLVRYDADNQLLSDIPDSFSISGDEITFTFGQRATAADGHPIDAEDAEASLKRLVLKGKSGHGDIRRFLCPNHTINSLNDICPGIRVESNKLILKVTHPNLVPLFIPLLESADYSIIPKENIDPVTGDLVDRSHRNTSGPYYVSSDSPDGHITLTANPNHYLYHSLMPQEVSLLPLKSSESIDRFERGELDLLPSAFYFTKEWGARVIDKEKYNVHETLPIRVVIMKFSKNAIEKFSQEQRLYVAQLAGRLINENISAFGSLPTQQFFQAMSDGALNEEQLEEIQKLRLFSSHPKFSKQIELALPHERYELSKTKFDEIDEIKLLDIQDNSIFFSKEKHPELFRVQTDTAWAENISLLGYGFEMGHFRVPTLDPEEWMRDYIHTENREDRIKKLNQLHFDVLRNASIVPIEAAPYYIVAKKKWTINQSRLFAGTSLWQMRKN